MADKLEELLGEYWSLAYAEGVEGRTHDTKAGDAQRVLAEIISAWKQMQQRVEGYDRLFQNQCKKTDIAVMERMQADKRVEAAEVEVLRRKTGAEELRKLFNRQGEQLTAAEAKLEAK